MKRIGVIGMLALAAGCGVGRPEATGPVYSDLPAELWLAMGEERLLSGTVTTLGFFDVPADSRCPAMASCVWAGDAAVTLGLRVGDRGPSYPLTLHTAATLRMDQDTLLGLRIRLLEVLPYPQTFDSIPRDQYRVRVRVTRVAE